MSQSLKLSKANPNKIFKNFCESTSLHGYSYLFSNDSIFSKIIWMSVILLMTGLGMFFFMINIQTFFEMKISTSMETSTEALKVDQTCMSDEKGTQCVFYNVQGPP